MENVALPPCLVQGLWGAHLAHHRVASSHAHGSGFVLAASKRDTPMNVASLVLPRSHPVLGLYTLMSHPKCSGSPACLSPYCGGSDLLSLSQGDLVNPHQSPFLSFGLPALLALWLSSSLRHQHQGVQTSEIICL